MIIAKGLNVDEPTNWELCLSTQLLLFHSRLVQTLIAANKAQICQSIFHFILPLLVNKTPRYINLLLRHIPDQEGVLHPFLRTVASNLSILEPNAFKILLSCEKGFVWQGQKIIYFWM